MRSAGKDAEETQANGSRKVDASGGSALAHPRDGSINTLRAPRSAVVPPPNPVEAWYYEGMAAYQHRHWDEALECFTRLKELQPTRPGLDALIDEVRWFQQLQAAAPAFDQPEAPARGPGSAARNLWRRLAPLVTALLAVLALLGVASMLFVATQGRLPWQSSATDREIEALYEDAQQRMAAGEYDGAEAAFQKVLEIAPDSAEAAEARRGIEQVTTLKELAQGYAAAGACIADRDWQCASGELEAILQRDSNYSNARAQADFVALQQKLESLYEDGSALYDGGKWADAIARFEQVRDLDVSYHSQAVSDALFTCYIYAGQDLLSSRGAEMAAVQRAVRYFDRAFGLDPDHPVAIDTRRLGSLYLEAMQAAAKGDAGRARSQLSTLVAEAPGYAGGEAMRQLYELTVADGQDALAAGDIPVALAMFGEAQGLPVSDTSAARRGHAMAVAVTATPLPSPTATPAPSSTPPPTQAVVAIPAAPRPTAVVQAKPTSTPLLLTCIRGYVRDVAGGMPLRGWVITLWDKTGAARPAVTDDAGQYSFDNVALGTYEIGLALGSGWHAVSPPRSTVVVAPAAGCLSADFWAEQDRGGDQPGAAPTPPR